MYRNFNFAFDLDMKISLKMSLKDFSNIAEIFSTASWPKTSPNLRLYFIKIANYLSTRVLYNDFEIDCFVFEGHQLCLTYVTDFNYDSTLLLQSVIFHVSCNFIAN
jgi:hypothetical protein